MRFRYSTLALSALLLACGTSVTGSPEDTPNDDAGLEPDDETGDQQDASSEDPRDAGGDGHTEPICGRDTTPCPVDHACEDNADCASDICYEQTCRATPPCGEEHERLCDTDESCATGGDCHHGVCGATKTCSAPTDDDFVQNGDETGIDCGGPTTPNRCPPGQGCNDDDDCDNVRCGTTAPKTCNPPTNDDGLQNGTETDVDCGGDAPTSADRCEIGKKCESDTDCAAPGQTCNYAKRCVAARSCRVHEGGDTCGAREVDQAEASHESCCLSVPLPNSTVKIDKYEITAGRMREFIRAVNNNVQGWVLANRDKTAQIPDDIVQYLPTGLSAPSRTIRRCNSAGGSCSSQSRQFGVYSHLGNTVFMPDRPCNNCGQGCWVGSGQYENGHPTYYWPDTIQQNQFGAAPRDFTQEQLDVKSLNCVTQPLLAAFCAWDGGRLPTQAELGSTTGAWGPSSHPWGNSPSYTDTVATNVPNRQEYGWPEGANQFLVPMRMANGAYNLNAYDDNTTNYNPFPNSPSIYQARYVFPMPMTPATNDQAYAVAAPGRMRRDFRAIGPNPNDGYFDVLGNVMEMVGNFRTCTNYGQTTSQCNASSGDGFCDAEGICRDNEDHNSWPQVHWVGASFEGHGASRAGHNLNIMTKYGKAGGRCARPLP